MLQRLFLVVIVHQIQNLDIHLTFILEQPSLRLFSCRGTRQQSFKHALSKGLLSYRVDQKGDSFILDAVTTQVNLIEMLILTNSLGYGTCAVYIETIFTQI